MGQGAPPLRVASLWHEALALLLPAAAILALRSVALAGVPAGATWSTDPAVNPIFAAPAATRLLTGALVWGYGLWLTLAPFSLAADYGAAVFPIVESCAQPAALLSLLAIAALVALALAAARRAPRHPLLFAGAAAFLGFGLLTANVLFPIGTIFGERLYYTPSLLVPCAVAWLAPRVAARHAPLALLLGGAWLGACAATLLDRNAAWRDNETLIRREVRTQPRSVRMRVQAARLLAERGEPASAMAQLEHALSLEPRHAPAWERLGDLCQDTGDTARAAGCYAQALRCGPAPDAGAAIRRKLAALRAAPARAPPAQAPR
jgi:tetratricopeptide (TPR) repeat protein